MGFDIQTKENLINGPLECIPSAMIPLLLPRGSRRGKMGKVSQIWGWTWICSLPVCNVSELSHSSGSPLQRRLDELRTKKVAGTGWNSPSPALALSQQELTAEQPSSDDLACGMGSPPDQQGCHWLSRLDLSPSRAWLGSSEPRVGQKELHWGLSFTGKCWHSVN